MARVPFDAWLDSLGTRARDAEQHLESAAVHAQHAVELQEDLARKILAARYRMLWLEERIEAHRRRPRR